MGQRIDAEEGIAPDAEPHRRLRLGDPQFPLRIGLDTMVRWQTLATSRADGPAGAQPGPRAAREGLGCRYPSGRPDHARTAPQVPPSAAAVSVGRQRLLARLSDAWAWLGSHALIGFSSRHPQGTWYRVTTAGAEILDDPGAVAKVWATERLAGELRSSTVLGTIELRAWGL